MFDFLSALDVLALWHRVATLGGWTLAAGAAIAGLVALGWLVAPARWPALVAILVIGAGWLGLIAGEHAGRAAVTAEWDAANTRAAAAAAARDEAVRAAVEARYKLEAAALQKRAADLSNQVDAYAQRLARAPGGNSCRLGDDALRLRARR